MERTSARSVRAVVSWEGVQVSLALSYMYAPKNIQFPLLNLTLEASPTVTSVDTSNASTVVTFSTTNRLSAVPIQTLSGSVQGQLDDGVDCKISISLKC